MCTEYENYLSNRKYETVDDGTWDDPVPGRGFGYCFRGIGCETIEDYYMIMEDLMRGEWSCDEN